MSKQILTDKEIVTSMLKFQEQLIDSIEKVLPIVDSLEQTKKDHPDDSKLIHYVALVEVMRQSAFEHCLTCILTDAFALSSSSEQFGRIIKIIDPDLTRSLIVMFTKYDDTDLEMALRSFIKLSARKKQNTSLETYLCHDVFSRLFAFVTDGKSLLPGYFSEVLH